MSVFYDTFERHDHGRGLKGHSTTYCPGCGHGLAHKYLADAIEELGVQDRTIAVSPVGCSVFLYYYLDVGNTQAAHGRAPAVALGHKVANPESIVVSYQGDGDLASIGLAEIVSVAQLGIPISVIFINNAIYGMTGGQMAPTTLMGQKTATSPYGRTRFTGEPLKVAEMMAGLDGPVYVERVALFDAKSRVKAEKAIKKAIRLQVEGKGFSFVEVLAECPTHLKMTPLESEKWVKEKMLPLFPLGVKKDVERAEAWPLLPPPNFMPGKMLDVLGGQSQPSERFCDGFPQTPWGRDIGIKLAGAGGDGAQTAALLIARAAINEGFDSTHIPSYGPESRGGTSYADVRVAADEVLSPAAPEPHILVAFNAPSVAKFAPQVQAGGVVVYDSSVVKELPPLRAGVKAVGVPFTRIAADLGKVIVKNIVALGALSEATRLFPRETFLASVRQALADKCALIPLNEEAFAWGVKSAAEAQAKGDA
jgi:2-oxoisovalerate ferredoxin oxidoreductase beta subunit